jgi:hypothetical protein
MLKRKTSLEGRVHLSIPETHLDYCIVSGLQNTPFLEFKFGPFGYNVQEQNLYYQFKDT